MALLSRQAWLGVCSNGMCNLCYLGNKSVWQHVTAQSHDKLSDLIGSSQFVTAGSAQQDTLQLAAPRLLSAANVFLLQLSKLA